MATIPILTKLVDAQQMHRDHPETFEAPTAHELAMITPGDHVKLCRNRERFWVEVKGARGKYLIGAINQILVFNANPNGSYVRFETRHVYSISKRLAGA